MSKSQGAKKQYIYILKHVLLYLLQIFRSKLAAGNPLTPRDNAGGDSSAVSTPCTAHAPTVSAQADSQVHGGGRQTRLVLHITPCPPIHGNGVVPTALLNLCVRSWCVMS